MVLKQQIWFLKKEKISSGLILEVKNSTNYYKVGLKARQSLKYLENSEQEKLNYGIQIEIFNNIFNIKDIIKYRCY